MEYDPLNLSSTELLKTFCHVSFSGSVWIIFNFFCFLFINNQSPIKLFAQYMIRSKENNDPELIPMRAEYKF